MGNLFSNHIRSRPCREVSRLHDSSGGLRNDASIRVLPASHFADDRNIQSSKKNSKDRQRFALEKLISSVSPFDASMVARMLIEEFTSIGRVFSATRESLQRVIGPNRDVIELIAATHNAIDVSLHADIEASTIQATDQRLIDYLVMSMGYLSIEQLRVMFLDRSNRLIRDEVVASGTLTSLMAYPRNIFRRAFDLSANGIVLVHNHPGGQSNPSRCDIEFTGKLKALGQQLEVQVMDHIIISGPRWFSFAREGAL